jgi:hypothetical protein
MNTAESVESPDALVTYRVFLAQDTAARAFRDIRMPVSCSEADVVMAVCDMAPEYADRMVFEPDYDWSNLRVSVHRMSAGASRGEEEEEEIASDVDVRSHRQIPDFEPFLWVSKVDSPDGEGEGELPTLCVVEITAELLRRLVYVGNQMKGLGLLSATHSVAAVGSGVWWATKEIDPPGEPAFGLLETVTESGDSHVKGGFGAETIEFVSRVPIDPMALRLAVLSRSHGLEGRLADGSVWDRAPNRPDVLFVGGCPAALLARSAPMIGADDGVDVMGALRERLDALQGRMQESDASAKPALRTRGPGMSP